VVEEENRLGNGDETTLPVGSLGLHSSSEQAMEEQAVSALTIQLILLTHHGLH
jgi:hypothetical protein